MRAVRILAWALCTAVLPVAGPRAELPPRVYENLRQRADVALILIVDSVKTAERKSPSGMRTVSVVAKARVFSVIRGTRLRQFETIVIRYTRQVPVRRAPGPGPIPLLRKRTRVMAWLNRNDGHFIPAARGRSFAQLR